MLKAVLVLALFGASAALYAVEDEAMVQYMWKEFKREYGKVGLPQEGAAGHAAPRA